MWQGPPPGRSLCPAGDLRPLSSLLASPVFFSPFGSRIYAAGAPAQGIEPPYKEPTLQMCIRNIKKSDDAREKRNWRIHQALSRLGISRLHLPCLRPTRKGPARVLFFTPPGSFHSGRAPPPPWGRSLPLSLRRCRGRNIFRRNPEAAPPRPPSSPPSSSPPRG